MKIKLSLSILLLSSLFALVYFDYQYTDKKLTAAVNIPATKSVPITAPIRSVTSYQVTIESAVLSENQVVITHSLLDWKMHLKANSTHLLSDGLLSDISFINNDKAQAIPQRLPFQFSFEDTQFKAVDLLSLPATHTLNVLPRVLNLMSFSIDDPLTFDSDQGSKTYRYQQKNQHVKRHEIAATTENHSQPMSDTEQWQLTLDDTNYPRTVNYQAERLWAQNNQHYQITQKVKITKLNALAPDFYPVSKTQNAQLKSEPQSDQQMYINDDASMYAALETLQTSLDPLLAKKIGAYILTHYDLTDFIALIDNDHSLSSALIYAIQKEQSPQAEQLLADLLIDNQLGDHIKQKVIIALGRFGASSHISFQTLVSLAQEQTHPLAATALLNLGSMAKFTPSQQQPVEQHLLKVLSGNEQLSTAILASANSQNDALYPKVAKLLNHKELGVQRDAIKVLSTHNRYHDQVVSALLQAPHVQSIDAFARTITDSGMTLTEYNKQRLQSLYISTENPIIKSRLKTLGVNQA